MTRRQLPARGALPWPGCEPPSDGASLAAIGAGKGRLRPSVATGRVLPTAAARQDADVATSFAGASMKINAQIIFSVRVDKYHAGCGGGDDDNTQTAKGTERLKM